MSHYVNIYGEPTTNPDAMTHCTACKRLLTADAYREEAECVCGADLTTAESIITGRMLREAREAVDAELAEWTRLNSRGAP